MTLRLRTLQTGLLALLMAALLAFAPTSTNAASGGHQLLERVNYGTTDDTSLTTLGNSAAPLETASECCNATNSVELPNGYRILNDGIGANRVDPPNGYRWVTDDGTPQLQSTTSGRIYASADDVPTPTGNFSGTHQANPKHDVTRPGVSPQPTNGADALANSVPIGGNSTGRIAYDQSTGEIVVFQNHLGNAFHGYVPLSFNSLPQAQRNALIRAGLFTARGRPIR